MINFETKPDILENLHTQSLRGKVAVITGASRGIGAAIAAALAREGARVVISSRKQENLEEQAAGLRAAGLNVLPLACHVGDPGQLKTLVDQTMAEYGRLDILINNAAINPSFGPLEDADPGAFDKTMAINVKAPWELARLALPHLEKQGGSIINISSVEGLKPTFGLGIYSVSKAALIMMSQNMAKEWGPRGVRVNVICPGLVKTRFSAALWQNESILQSYETHVPLGRMAQPEEMTGMAVFLASDAASYVTGGVFMVDGGYMVGN